jgi:hypothetical protein
MAASEFLAGPTPPLAWVWEPYLPVGSLSLLTAYAKIGKSTFAYPLALAIARGKPFLGTPTTQGPVLILAVEEHARDARLRLERFGATPTDPVAIHAGRLDPSAFGDMRKYVKQEGVRLVLLDTLSRYWNIRDENDNPEIERLVSPFLDLAHETDAAVVLIHHHRKSGGSDGHAIRGGGGLLAIVDQALSLEKRPDGAGNPQQRVLRALGRYSDYSPAEMVLELDGDEYRAVGTPAHFTSEAQQALVLGALTDVPQTVAALMLTTKLKRSPLDRVLKSLGPLVARQGEGTKADPYRYCRPFPFSGPTESEPEPAGSPPGCFSSQDPCTGVDDGKKRILSPAKEPDAFLLTDQPGGEDWEESWDGLPDGLEEPPVESAEPEILPEADEWRAAA